MSPRATPSRAQGACGWAAGTVCARRHLALARVLARSFRHHHPDVPFVVLLADEVTGALAVDGSLEPAAEPFELVPLAALVAIGELAEEERRALCFAYDAPALTYAVTPLLLRHLLGRGFAAAVHLKEESYVTGALDPLVAALASSSLVITPHLCKPLGVDGAARELEVLLAGSYNVGVLGVGATPAAEQFLAWWWERLRWHCTHDVAAGLHWEQRWVDLAPALFEGVRVLREPGWNVGHWSLPETVVRLRGGRPFADGAPLRVFRFSGCDPRRPLQLTRHTSRVMASALGAALPLLVEYLAALDRAGHRQELQQPYAWSRFADGVPIPALARELFRTLGEGAARFGDPFAVGAGSFRTWLGEADAAASLGRLWTALHDRREDLRLAFPQPAGADRGRYLAWLRGGGAAEAGIDAALLPPLDA